MAKQSKLARWLFGAPPEIFDEEGHVTHDLKSDTWEASSICSPRRSRV